MFEHIVSEVLNCIFEINLVGFSWNNHNPNFTHVDDIIRGMILVANHGYGDNYGIGCHDSYSILEVANMFGGVIEMLPERRGNRMAADINTEKTEALGWKANKKLKDHIESPD